MSLFAMIVPLYFAVGVIIVMLTEVIFNHESIIDDFQHRAEKINGFKFTEKVIWTIVVMYIVLLAFLWPLHVIDIVKRTIKR